MLVILSYLVFLACVICWVIVVIKMFQNAGPLHGILGIICGLYALIWGWMNATKLGIKNIMMIWTLLLVVGTVLNFVAGASMIPSGIPTTTSP